MSYPPQEKERADRANVNQLFFGKRSQLVSGCTFSNKWLVWGDKWKAGIIKQYAIPLPAIYVSCSVTDTVFSGISQANRFFNKLFYYYASQLRTYISPLCR
jgi:hypothetical protein